ncbi:outer membrane lipoprotein carrier protein LolA [Streptomyces sannanensis]|uniref:Outer membrane lipoprotein carrier protein LolA n=1 Tax=Streptomyces sannanensis TaxID=285536 RepID=A0ABP6SDX1_9ACTN
MAPNDSAPRRKAARYLVPVTVAGVAAATIGLVPALAASGDPDLPKISAQELIQKIAESDVQQLSGTVKITTDLGLPSLAGLDLGSLAPEGAPEGGATASPEAKLMELSAGTHTLRVAADGPDKQKLSILDNAAEFSLIHNGQDVWAYDSKSNEVFHSEAQAEEGKRGGHEKMPATPQEFAQEALKAVDSTTSVTVDGTARIAGRDAYQLLIKPKQSGSTIGSIKIAVDAQKGVPLKFTLTPSGGGKAAVDAGFTKVDFAQPAAGTFDFTPPKGAKVTEDGEESLTPKQRKDADELEKQFEKNYGKGLEKGFQGPAGAEEFKGLNVIGEGWTTVAELKAPGGAGLPAKGAGEMPPEASQFLNTLGSKVSGKFGEGTFFSTRLVNALLTEDGTVYVGAVTKDALIKAADEAK